MSLCVFNLLFKTYLKDLFAREDLADIIPLSASLCFLCSVIT